MTACTFTDFMETLNPWLSTDYIRRAKLEEEGRFVLVFSDGGQRVFEIDSCTRSQLESVVALLRQKGIPVES